MRPIRQPKASIVVTAKRADNFDVYVRIAEAFGLTVQEQGIAGDESGNYYMVQVSETNYVKPSQEACELANLHGTFSYGNTFFFCEWLLKLVYAKAIDHKLEEKVMKLHGIKLYPLRRYTAEAAAVYQLVSGVMYNANSLVPAGVNRNFQAIIELQETMPEGYCVGDLLKEWCEKLKVTDY